MYKIMLVNDLSYLTIAEADDSALVCSKGEEMQITFTNLMCSMIAMHNCINFK